MSSLVSSKRNVPWNKRQRRSYQRVLSGITRSQAQGKRLRIITLTSSPASLEGVHPFDEGLILSRRWQTLRKRIQRKFMCRLEYFRMRTNEGNGVLHIVYRGPYIPQSWLSRQWEEIHRASVVYIQALYGRKRLAKYLVSSYLGGHHSFTRSSWSWNWVFRGFVRTWHMVLGDSDNFLIGLNKWNILLRVRDPKNYYLENRKKKRWREFGTIRPLTSYR